MAKSIKLALACAPLIFISNKTLAQTQLRSNVTVRLDSRLFNDHDDKSVEENVADVLKYNNIYVDPKSMVQIREENNFVDLNCFNCIIIQHVGPEAYAHSPENKEVFVP